MTNIQRHRFFDASPTFLPCNSDQAIEVGDLLYLEVDDVRSVIQATQTTLANTRAYVHDRLVGVAMSQHRANDTAVLGVTVATSGVFEFLAATGTWHAGDYASPGAGAGAAVVAQTVAVTTAGNESIAVGSIEREYGALVAGAGVTVLVRLFPTKFAAGGQQASA